MVSTSRRYTFYAAAIAVLLLVFFSACSEPGSSGSGSGTVLLPEASVQTYSDDFGALPTDVYFIFTNLSTGTEAVSKPEVYSLSGPSEKALDGGETDAAGIRPQRSEAPDASGPIVIKDSADAADFMANPPALVPGGPAGDGASKSLIFPVPPEPQYSTVGETASFIISSMVSVEATLRGLVSSTAVSGGSRSLEIWVADDCWTSGGSKAKLVDGTMVDFLAGNFLAAGAENDIYDWVTAVYGAEWGSHGYSNLIAPTDTVVILLYDIDNDNSTSGGTVGLYHPKDNYKTTSISTSNERIMFYLDAVLLATPDPITGTWDATDYWPEQMVSTLVHEFQHMVHFYQKTTLRASGTGTDTWLNEMASMATEDLLADKIFSDGPRGVAYNDYTAGAADNTSGRLPLYNYYNDISLIQWLSGDDVYESYSIAYAFGAYLARNFGGAELFREIVLNPYVDEQAVTAGLAEVGSSETFATVLRKWGAANLHSDNTTAEAGFVYNSGVAFTSAAGGIDYTLGSINLYNYTYGGRDGLYLYTASPVGTWNPKPASNTYYRAGSGLTGSHSWTIECPAGVVLTVVTKN